MSYEHTPEVEVTISINGWKAIHPRQESTQHGRHPVNCRNDVLMFPEKIWTIINRLHMGHLISEPSYCVAALPKSLSTAGSTGNVRESDGDELEVIGTPQKLFVRSLQHSWPKAKPELCHDAPGGLRFILSIQCHLGLMDQPALLVQKEPRLIKPKPIACVPYKSVVDTVA